MKSELVAVGTHDIVACIPDIIPNLPCSANLISATMEVHMQTEHTWSHDAASGGNIKYCIELFPCFPLYENNILIKSQCMHDSGAT